MGTAVDKASAQPDMVKKAKAYNIPGKKVDGMDIFEVYKETSRAIAACRKGNGPQLLEMITYRYEGHSIGDRTRYRPAGELDKWRDEKDPIHNLQKVLLEEYDTAEQDLVAINEAVEKEVEEAVAFANESPLPALDTLFHYIYPEN
jgi:pyruvate dehydrogenase E1 component alpha subunit